MSITPYGGDEPENSRPSGQHHQSLKENGNYLSTVEKMDSVTFVSNEVLDVFKSVASKMRTPTKLALARDLEASITLHGKYSVHGKNNLRKPRGKQSTITKVHGRCVQTNRTRSVSRLFKISRHKVRQLAVKGNIPGCTKAT